MLQLVESSDSIFERYVVGSFDAYPGPVTCIQEDDQCVEPLVIVADGRVGS
jgi:hypothetical protein